MKQYYQLLISIFRNRLTLKKAFVPFLLLFFMSFSEVNNLYGAEPAGLSASIESLSFQASTRTITVSFPVAVNGTNAGGNLSNDIYINAPSTNYPIGRIRYYNTPGYTSFVLHGVNYYFKAENGCTMTVTGSGNNAVCKIVLPHTYANISYQDQYDIELWTKYSSSSSYTYDNEIVQGFPNPSIYSWSASQDICNYVNISASKPNSNIYIQYKRTSSNSWSYATSGTLSDYFVNNSVNPNNKQDYQIRYGYGPLMMRAVNGTVKSGRIPAILGEVSTPNGSVDNCDSTITLSWVWNESNPGGGYNIERQNEFGQWIFMENISGSNNSYSISHLNIPNPNEDYSFRISALNECDIAGLPTEITGKWLDLPSAPTNFEAKDTTLENGRAIFLSWKDNAINESRYVLKKTLFGGSTSEYIYLNENDTTYIDDNAAICNKYIYEVFAQNICTGLEDGSGTSGTGNIEKVLTFDLNTTFNPNDNSTTASTERFIGSKGYFPDRVEIKWSTANNLNLIEYFKIYRRQLGFSEAFTQIASVTSSSQIYIDETTNAGTLYEYLIIGEAQCLTETVFTDSLVGIGFRSPTAIVNGQVNYTGGVAVEDVKVLFETTTQSGKSVKLDGNSYLKVKNGFADSQNEFYLENWIYPINDSVFTIFEHGNFVFKYNNNQFEFSLNGIDSVFSIGQLSIGQWQHVGLALKNGLLYLFLNGEGKSILEVPNSFSLSSSGSIKVGQGLVGKVEEIRFWESVTVDTNQVMDTIVTVNMSTTPFTNDTTIEKSLQIVAPQITKDFSRYINGGETGLVTYLRLDEYAGQHSYDLSYSGLAYNRNNAEFIGLVTREDEKPTASQLSYAAYTNELGSYTATIPYTGVGQNFTVTPSYKTHQFDPPTTALFLGDGSSVNNGVDFEDISSFPVTGTLFYKNTTCAVKDAYVLVNGERVIANGVPIKTNDEGHFSVQVPIGFHTLEVEKDNHVFSNGKWSQDFQEPVIGLEFVDSTLIKVVGRVAGGNREKNKLPNLGYGTNNLGQASIEFESQQGGGCVVKTIATNPNTGEYEVYLPPLKYIPSVSIPKNPTIDFGTLDLLDFKANKSITTVRDSLYNEIDSSLTVDSTSFKYQVDYIYLSKPKIEVYDPNGKDRFIGDTIYSYNDPVTDSIININLRVDSLQRPILSLNHPKGYRYKALIRVYEQYENRDSILQNGISKLDSVPSTSGQLTFNNEFTDEGSHSIELDMFNTIDSIKTLVYSFAPTGIPNFQMNTSDNSLSYTKKMEINLDMADGTHIKWLPHRDKNGLEIPFTGYFLAGLSVGNQFVTEGPDDVDFILRDPPGSGSFAEREVGSSTTTTDSWNYAVGGGFESKNTIKLGSEFSAGVGVQVKTKVTGEIGAHFSSSVSYEREGELSTTYETSNAWATDDGEDQAGAGSDLFIGKSRNVEFGIVKSLSLIPNSDCATLNCYGNSSNGLQLGERYQLSVVPGGYETQFIYSANHIKNYLIPDLINLRNVLLQSDSKYISHLNVNDPNYGINNDDPRLANPSTLTPLIRDYQDFTGDSYTYTPLNEEDSVTDKLWNYNHQIKKWEKALYDNEWEKVIIEDETIKNDLRDDELDDLYNEYKETILQYEQFTEDEKDALLAVNIYALIGDAEYTSISFAETTLNSIQSAEISNVYHEYLAKKNEINSKYNISKSNYSISAGSSFTSSITQSRVTSTSSTYSYNMTAEVNTKLGVEVNGTGFELERNLSLTFDRGRSSSNEFENSETTVFTLADGDQGDYFSVDVYPSILGYGPIFKLKEGGRTSCPFEDEIVTEYYEPGTVISAKTLQRDKPSINISPSTVQNVPLDEAATFSLTLGNNSESNDSRIYNYQLVHNSNPYGAIVKIDGLEPTGSVAIDGNAAFQKTLTVEKGPGPVYHYDSLLFIITAPCQYEAGTADNQDIADSVYFSAHFIPGCSDVALASPSNQWVLNNSFNDTMQLSVVDYNINFFDLQRFRIDYKPSSQANWIGLESYYKDTTNMDDPDLKLIPRNAPFTFYDWDVAQLTDGEYDLRVVTECNLADDNSPTYSGVIDRVNPHAFGSPSPADGILGANDDISIQFNENVEAGSLTSKNFDIRGVLNGSPLRHQASVEFDGASSYVEIPTGLNLQSRDFTIEFWAQNKDFGNSVFLSQGSGAAEGLKIGTESSGKVYVEIAGERIRTAGNVANQQNWHHYAFAYNYSEEEMYIFIDGNLKNHGNIALYPDYIGSGKILVGKSTFGDDDYFEGNMHDLRVWNHTRSLSDVVVNLAVQVGKQNLGLLHNWKMDEATGESIEDHVRFRNGILHNTEWDLNPGGNAITFDASNNDNYKFTSANVAFVDEVDFTVEFWFNGSDTTRQTLFSNGKGDGIGADSLTSWNITKYTDGSIHLLHNGVDVQAVDSGSFDGNWHHFALSVNRGSVVTTYLDGNTTSTTPSVDFREFGSDQIVLGSRYFINGIVRTYDEYFNGSIDEFRIWKLSRTQKQIQRDMRYKLEGDEFGLVSYMPFETYTQNLGVYMMDSTYQDLVDTSHHVTYVDYSFTLNSPKIKLPRPIEKLNFDFSVNGDKIVLTPTTPAHRFENVTLDITVQNVKDLHGNSMQSPKTWIAYPDRNQVVWETEAVSFEIMKDEALTFTKKIVNSGGSIKNFTLENIPNWLTTDVTEGVINPGSTFDIEFTKVEGVNIGSYKEDVIVMTDFGYPERLTVSLKVNGEEPTWEVNPQAFDKSMSVIGAISINDVVSIDDEDILYAFIDGECRGKAYLQYISSTDKYVAFLDVYSNYVTPDTVDFKIYDASTGSIFVDITPDDITFSSDGLIGSLLIPETFSAYSKVQENHPLQVGWNWISFHLATIDTLHLENLLSSIELSNGDQIKTLGNNTFATFDETFGWIGNLQTTGVKLAKGYKLKVANADTLSNIGDVVDPTTVPITMNQGWNWIGFVSIRPMNINVALGNLEPQSGDLIKGRAQFSVYDEQLGWIGSLNTLYPNQSYMYKSSNTNDITFTFPFAGGFKFASPQPYKEIYDARWPMDYSKHISNMSAIVELTTCTDIVDVDAWYVGFFDGTGTCRSLSTLNSTEDKLLTYVTAVGADQLNLTPRLLNKKTGQEFILEGKLAYKQNEHIGSFESPVEINLTEDQCRLISNIDHLSGASQGSNTEGDDVFEDADVFSTTVYPSLFSSELFVRYHSASNTEVRIEMINALGQIVRHYKKTVHQGNQEIKLNRLSRLAKGIYTIRISDETSMESFKLIKKD
ncbi:MAG: LamG-like jellyroll fold domain-containing protein [Flavobacteriales bacterium]